MGLINMGGDELEFASGEGWARFWRVAKSITALGVIGHMGRNLIEGLTLWVWLVDVYHRLVTPIADVFGKILQVPLVWMASLFDFTLALQDYPLWGFDMLALTALAMRMFGGGAWRFERWRTEAKVTITLTLLLGVTIYVLYNAPLLYGPPGPVFSAILGYLLGMTLFGSIRVLAELASRTRFASSDPTNQYQESVGLLGISMFLWPIYLLSISELMDEVFKALSSIMRWLPVLIFGTVVLLLNSYADVAIPPVERLLTAWDFMIQDWMTLLAGRR
jgi:hypothetical protein